MKKHYKMSKGAQVMKKLILNTNTLLDLECILHKYMAPLATFMNRADFHSVLQNMRLSTGPFFPLPVCLFIPKNSDITLNDTVELRTNTELPIATMYVSDKYPTDNIAESLGVAATTEPTHPYVASLQSRGEGFYISGPLKKINDIPHYNFAQWRTLPTINPQKPLIGFQTRNPMHRAHVELTKIALAMVKEETATPPDLLLNPVIGTIQEDDIPISARVTCYEEVLKCGYEDTRRSGSQVHLHLLPYAMRMAGPKEACMHALIRKNMGCTHFIVGRDHAGPSTKKRDGTPFYAPLEAHRMLTQWKDEIGITPVLVPNVAYNTVDEKYYPVDQLPLNAKTANISGTEVRRCLQTGEEIPAWFSYPSVVSILRSAQKPRGICYYFVGLSGSGKTHHANEFQHFLEGHLTKTDITVLDADIVRQHLSKGLGFSKEDRSTNVQRIGYVASEIVKHNGVCIVANIAPYQEDRDANRKMIESIGGKYIEIFVDTDIATCRTRDVKGLYKAADAGTIKNFTGVSDPFEVPQTPEYIIKDNKVDYEKLLSFLPKHFATTNTTW